LDVVDCFDYLVFVAVVRVGVGVVVGYLVLVGFYWGIG